MEQSAPFKPGFTLGERAESIKKQNDGSFIVTTNEGTRHKAPVIIIAGGLGSFEPRKPKILNIEVFEKKGVEYMVKDPNIFIDKKVFISGGGDSALDWCIYFAEKNKKKVGLVHRSESFRAHKDSVEKIYHLHEEGKIELYTNAEVIKLNGINGLDSIEIRTNNNENKIIKVDTWFPLFGLSPKLGPIADWGLEIEKNAIKVDNTIDYQTNIPGIFAVGDVNTYLGKLKLILCGFHEATLAVQSAYKIINPDKRYTLKYTTVQGIQGFD
tara:strand:- start:608 stop:1414 length:807 start_codon:yes stop_codon:yes gene_type:complete